MSSPDLGDVAILALGWILGVASATRRSYWQGLYAAREAIAALDISRDVRFSVDVKADAIAAIDALRAAE